MPVIPCMITVGGPKAGRMFQCGSPIPQPPPSRQASRQALGAADPAVCSARRPTATIAGGAAQGTSVPSVVPTGKVTRWTFPVAWACHLAIGESHHGAEQPSS